MLKHTIKFPLFEITVLVISGSPVVEALEQVGLAPDRSLESCDAVTTEFTKVVDVGFCCVVAFESNTPPVGVISHEAVHVVSNILNHCGVESRDEELLAYMVGYLTGKIHKNLSTIN